MILQCRILCCCWYQAGTAMALFTLSAAMLLLIQVCTADREFWVGNGFVHNNQNYRERTILNLQGLDTVRAVTSTVTVSNSNLNAEVLITSVLQNGPDTFATMLQMKITKCTLGAGEFFTFRFMPPLAYIHIYQLTGHNRNGMNGMTLNSDWGYNVTMFIEDTDFTDNPNTFAVFTVDLNGGTLRDYGVLHVKKAKVTGGGVFKCGGNPEYITNHAAMVFEDITVKSPFSSMLTLLSFQISGNSALIIRNVVSTHPSSNTVSPFFEINTITVDATSLLSFTDIDVSNGFKAKTSKALKITKIDGTGTIVFSRWLMQSSGLTNIQPVKNANFWVSARTSANTDLTPKQLRDQQKFNVNVKNTYHWNGTGEDTNECVPVGGGIPGRATYNLVKGKCAATCNAGYLPPACTARAASQCRVDNCDLCYRNTKTKCFVCARHTKIVNTDTTCRCPIDGCQVCPSATECTKCQKGYILSADKKSCSNCPIDYCLACTSVKICAKCAPYYNITNPGNPNRCMPCMLEHCVLCGRDNNCKECAEGYTKPAGGTGDCVPCNVKHCERCDTANECARCRDKYTPYGSQHCYACATPGCLACNGDEKCIDCDGNSTLVGTTCVGCFLTNCKSCSSDGICAQCVDYYNVSADHKACYDCRIDNCLSCTSEKICAKCAPRYSLQNSGKPNSRCMPCMLDNCVLCGSENNCEQCADGSTKPAGGTGDCVPCNVKHCERCDTANECAQCIDKHTLADSQHCYPCTMPGCLACSGDEQCRECGPGYTLFEKKCVECSIPNCQACHRDGVCVQCDATLSVSPTGRECIPCDIGNCTHCSGSGECAVCECGMVPTEEGRECVPCTSEKCKHCEHPGTGKKCAECVEGYKPSADGRCLKVALPPWAVFLIVVIVTIIFAAAVCVGVFLCDRHQKKLKQSAIDAEDRRRNRQGPARQARRHMDINVLDLGDIEGAAGGIRDY